MEYTSIEKAAFFWKKKEKSKTDKVLDGAGNLGEKIVNTGGGAALGLLAGIVGGGAAGAAAGKLGHKLLKTPIKLTKKVAKKSAKKGSAALTSNHSAAVGGIGGGLVGAAALTPLGAYKGFTKESKEKDNDRTAGIAALAAGTTVGGAGYVDVRKKTNLDNVQKLNPKDLKLNPGDVLVGGDTPVESIEKDIRKGVRKGVRRGAQSQGIVGAAMGAVDGAAGTSHATATLASKLGNPKQSHVETAFSARKTGYIGGGAQANLKDTTDQLKKNKGQYLVMRRKTPVSAGETKRIAQAVRLGGDSYDQKGIVKSQLKDWFFPKLRRNERNVAKTNIGCAKGVCSTAAPLATGRTVGGKNIQDTLPGDYLRSPDYEVAGFVGHGKTYSKVPKTMGGKLLKAVPHVARGVAGLAAAGTAYGAVNAYKAFKNRKSNS
jgi:hypothetical protein